MTNKLWELRLKSRPNSITGNMLYELSFGNLQIASFANDETLAERRFQSLIDQDADTANGFMNLWNSLSIYEQLESGIDNDTIRKVFNLGIEQDHDMGYDSKLKQA
jgi:hypothetical protein